MRVIGKYLFAVAVIGLIGCGSSHPSAETKPPVSTPEAKPAQIAKYYFFFSSSGFSNRPSDAMRVDSNLQMDFETRKKGADGAWHALKGMAVLEPEDYDTLASIITEGKLLDLEQADLMTSCPSGESYTLTFGSTLRPKPTHIDYTACSIDYNLLIKPHRTHFVELAHWFDQMREKYRPEQPQ